MTLHAVAFSCKRLLHACTGGSSKAWKWYDACWAPRFLLGEWNSLHCAARHTLSVDVEVANAVAAGDVAVELAVVVAVETAGDTAADW